MKLGVWSVGVACGRDGSARGRQVSDSDSSATISEQQQQLAKSRQHEERAR